MAKSKKSNKKSQASKINEHGVLIVLAVILLVSVAVLIIRDRRSVELIDPVEIEQPAE